MPILTIVITIIVAGILLWLVNKFIPMDAKIKMVLNAVAIIVLVVWLLKVFGIWSYLSNVHV